MKKEVEVTPSSEAIRATDSDELRKALEDDLSSRLEVALIGFGVDREPEHIQRVASMIAMLAARSVSAAPPSLKSSAGAGEQPAALPTNEDFERLWEEHHYGHAADFAADVLERWGGIPAGLLGYGGALNAATKEPAEQCNHCMGTGRMVRDPDIGTDQECFVCEGSGKYADEPADTAPVQELPPLPNFAFRVFSDAEPIGYFSADQMREYASAALSAAPQNTKDVVWGAAQGEQDIMRLVGDYAEALRASEGIQYAGDAVDQKWHAVKNAVAALSRPNAPVLQGEREAFDRFMDEDTTGFTENDRAFMWLAWEERSHLPAIAPQLREAVRNAPVLQGERELFQAWAADNGFNPVLRDDADSPDTFFAYETEQRWKVWKAARASSAAQIQEQQHLAPAVASGSNGPDAGLKGGASLGEQVKRAQSEMAEWPAGKAASARLEGGK